MKYSCILCLYIWVCLFLVYSYLVFGYSKSGYLCWWLNMCFLVKYMVWVLNMGLFDLLF